MNYINPGIYGTTFISHLTVDDATSDGLALIVLNVFAQQFAKRVVAAMNVLRTHYQRQKAYRTTKPVDVLPQTATSTGSYLVFRLLP